MRSPFRRPMSVLVALAKLRLAVLKRFAARSAEDYERHRQGARWNAERRAFIDLYRRVAPRSVLDCPVGTGRWLDIYQDSSARVLGVDLSPLMLAEARVKVRPGQPVTLVEGDILDPAQSGKLGTAPDLAVCTRFTHWLPTSRLGELFGAFRSCGARKLLVGAKLRRDRATDPPSPPHSVRQALRRVRAWLLNGRVNHIHEEKALLDIVEKIGGTVVERRMVMKTSTSVYVFLLIEFILTASSASD